MQRDEDTWGRFLRQADICTEVWWKEGGSHPDTWGKSFHIGRNRYKGPEAGAFSGGGTQEGQPGWERWVTGKLGRPAGSWESCWGSRLVCFPLCFLLLLFCFVCVGHTQWSMQDLSSPIRDRTQAPCMDAWRPNHWTSREDSRVQTSYRCSRKPRDRDSKSSQT